MGYCISHVRRYSQPEFREAGVWEDHLQKHSHTVIPVDSLWKEVNDPSKRLC